MLTTSKQQELRDLLAKVNVSEICKELGVYRIGIYRTLNGEGARYDDLQRVAARAREILKRQQEKIQSI